MNTPIVYSCVRIYSAVITLGAFFAVPILSRIKAASPWNVAQRNGLPALRQPIGERPVVWVHAASMGEAKLAVKFLDFLKSKHPGDVYLLTAATRAGVDYLRAAPIGAAVAAGYLPLDTLHLMRGMLKAFGVRRVWLMETEVWPSMMLSCMRAGVPVGIANGRMEEKSFAVYRRFRALCSPLFSALDIVLAQNESYALRFRGMGTRPEAVHITGNLKCLVDIAPVPLPRRRALRASLNIGEDDFVLTAGCVHAGEGRILGEMLSIVNNSGRRIKCIVVPRHLSETPSLINELGGFVLRLKEAASELPWDTCIIDKMGVLDDMYKAADAAFVGGTFVAVGGHSIWDAAQFALPVLFGPDYHTQRDSFDQIMRAGVGFCAASSRELAERILAILQNGATVPASAFSELAQSSRRQIQRIERLLP